MEAKSGRRQYVLGNNREVFVYHALPLGWLSLVVDNESRPHVVTCSHSRLAVVRYYQLISTPDSQHEGP